MQPTQANDLVTCTLCGHRFDPAQHPSCGSCPLHSGCSMACCPNCGASNINPAGSRLATWIQSFLRGKHVESSVLAHTHDENQPAC